MNLFSSGKRKTKNLSGVLDYGLNHEGSVNKSLKVLSFLCYRNKQYLQVCRLIQSLFLEYDQLKADKSIYKESLWHLEERAKPRSANISRNFQKVQNNNLLIRIFFLPSLRGHQNTARAAIQHSKTAWQI